MVRETETRSSNRYLEIQLTVFQGNKQGARSGSQSGPVSGNLEIKEAGNKAGESTQGVRQSDRGLKQEAGKGGKRKEERPDVKLALMTCSLQCLLQVLDG